MVRFSIMLLALGGLSACTGGVETVSSSDADPTQTFEVQFPTVDTDWPLDTDPADTDVGDTDPADTDVGDTDPADTDVGDTDPADTDSSDTDS